MRTTTRKTTTTLILFALFVCFAGSALAAPTVYYTLDNTKISGTTAIDSAGTQNATLSGTYSTGTTGKLGEAVTFTTGTAVLGNPAALQSNSLTWAAWIKPASIGASRWAFYGGTSGADDLEILQFANGTLRCISRTSGGRFVVASNTQVSAGNWYRVVCSHNSATNQLQIYVNGVNEASKTTTGGALAPTAARVLQFGSYDGGTSNYAGVVDEFGFWNYALSGAEVTADYNGGAGYNYYPAGAAAKMLTISLNDTRTSTSISGFTYSLTNGTITWSGYCSSTSCSQNSTNITGGTLTFSNITGGYYGATVSGITFNTTNAQTVIGQTYRSNINVTAYDLVAGASINRFCLTATNGSVTFSGLDYCTGTGSILVGNIEGAISLTVHNINDGSTFPIPWEQHYFNKSASYTGYNATSAYRANTSQALLTLQAYQLYTNASILSFNVSNGAAANNSPDVFGRVTIPGTKGQNNLTINVSGNYSKESRISISSYLQQAAANITGIYDARYSIGANSYDGSPISSFNLSGSQATFGPIYQQQTTNGTLLVPLLQGYSYLFVANNTLYSVANATLPANASTHHYNFTLYSTNSVNISVYDEVTGALLSNQSTSIEFVGSIQQYNYTAANGSTYVDLLAPDTYNVLFTSNGYLSRSYIITVYPQSSQVMSAYLLPTAHTTASQVVFTVTDLAGDVLDNALVTVESLQGSTYRTIESRLTDFSGQVQLDLDTSRFYRVTVSKSGYVTKQSQIQPTAVAYTVRLSAQDQATAQNVFDDITVSYSPRNATLPPGEYNFTFVTTSASGSLSFFGLFNGATGDNVTTSPSGGTAHILLDYSGVSSRTSAVITYYFMTVNGSYYEYNRTYTIYNFTQQTNGTISDVPTKYESDIGTGGKIIIGVILVLLVLLGLGTFISGAYLGMIGLLLIIGMWAFGLFPLWMSAIFGLLMGLSIFINKA